jgi:hypothetical protein
MKNEEDLIVRSDFEFNYDEFANDINYICEIIFLITALSSKAEYYMLKISELESDCQEFWADILGKYVIIENLEDLEENNENNNNNNNLSNNSINNLSQSSGSAHLFKTLSKEYLNKRRKSNKSLFKTEKKSINSGLDLKNIINNQKREINNKYSLTTEELYGALDNSALLGDLEKLRKKLNEEKKEKTNLLKIISENEKLINSDKEELNNLKTTNNQLKNKITDLETHLNLSNSEKENINKLLNEKLSLNVEIQSKLHIKTEECEDLKNKLLETEKEKNLQIENLKKEIKDLTSLKEKNKLLNEENQKVKKKYNEYKEDAEYKEKYNKLEIDFHNLKVIIEKNNEDINNYKNQIEELLKKNQELEARCNKFKNDLKELIRAIKEEKENENDIKNNVEENEDLKNLDLDNLIENHDVTKLKELLINKNNLINQMRMELEALKKKPNRKFQRLKTSAFNKDTASNDSSSTPISKKFNKMFGNKGVTFKNNLNENVNENTKEDEENKKKLTEDKRRQYKKKKTAVSIGDYHHFSQGYNYRKNAGNLENIQEKEEDLKGSFTGKEGFTLGDLETNDQSEKKKKIAKSQFVFNKVFTYSDNQHISSKNEEEEEEEEDEEMVQVDVIIEKLLSVKG